MAKWNLLIHRFIHRFIHEDSGASAIEYAVIAAIVAVGLISVLGGVNDEIGNVFSSITESLQNVAGSGQ